MEKLRKIVALIYKFVLSVFIPIYLYGGYILLRDLRQELFHKETILFGALIYISIFLILFGILLNILKNTDD